MTTSKSKKKLDEAPKVLAVAVSKKLENYDHSKPQQLTLFEMLLPQDKDYSNTIELYDFIPKYTYGKVERIADKFLDLLEREFECRTHKYKVQISPAVIKDKDGIARYYYPSKREEIIEDALRKFMAEGQGYFLDGMAGVTFTLYQLQEELKKNDHSYSIQQLKDALMICARTNLTVTNEEGKAIVISNIFETVGLQTREDWKTKGKSTKAFVRFNSLVTKSIEDLTFRQINYEKVMSYRSVIARQLHKRMSHHFTQASIHIPYTISLTTIIRDFGLTKYAKLSGNLRDVEIALEEMKEKKILIIYHIDKVLESSKRSKLIDAMFSLHPNPHFVSDSIKANTRTKEIKHKIYSSDSPK
ncbi:hypothetical protein EPA93_03805 [Ktedonosporobacter rubrisoli]|uniref:RepB family plasmid replication initiator protein n=1 Tax=Ktedonosporobacter rubrisoli TaxID=2509675 RepID=A0A4P6JJ81_KTERU|nr:hypothetical protein [Ktedonosporobacter rubrisoli]QBD75164.1 hypothetical protein EPA93_03805 [Ktedonosporobacter rubrisoli]